MDRKPINSIIVLFSIVLLFFITSGCSKKTSVVPGINYQKLNEAFSQAQQIGNLRSLIVYAKDTIIKEACYGTGGSNVRHDIRSVTKSVTGILIGIAIDKGFIKSIEQTLGDYLDTNVYNISTAQAAIKIKHLLTMSGGFGWDELSSNEQYNNWVTSENQVQYLFDKALVTEPGTYFTYNTAALHLLSVIIEKASGMKTKDFALKYLFTPMGVEEIEWETDNQGFNNGGSGLQITPYDMVKIGNLILNNGIHNGTPIVSGDYLNQSILTHISTNNTISFGPGYGYCWWTGQNTKGNYAFANGYGGQFIVIVPSLKLIVVATNQWNGVGFTQANNQWYATLDLILNKILQAFN